MRDERDTRQDPGRALWWRRVSFALSLIQAIVSYRFPSQFGLRSDWWFSANQAFQIVMTVLAHRYPWQPGRRFTPAHVGCLAYALVMAAAVWWGRKQRARQRQAQRA